MLDFNSLRRVHFIGIGGVSLSSLALFLRKKNIAVSGSDRAYSERLTELTEAGCEIWIGSRPEKIGVPDLTVYSGAVKPTDPELAHCRSRGVPCLERNLFLTEVSRLFNTTIAVAGTHGKTTTTAMLAEIFIKANLPIYAHVGGDTVLFGNSYYSGDGYFLTEACEYKRSLLSLAPNMGIVLNAETDHPDTYRSLTEIYDTFDTFLDISRKSGYAITDGDTPYYRLRQAHLDTVTYGYGEHNRFSAKNLLEYKNGFFAAEIYDYGSPIGEFRLSVPGRHNVTDALAAFVAAYLIGLDSAVICEAINGFRGVKRRFEKTSLFLGATVYSDYAHHPNEIAATIATARRLLPCGKRIFAVFQPHTYSRTARLIKDFLHCFDGCDYLIICREYAARETPDQGMDARTLFDRIDKKEKVYCDDILSAAAVLMQKITPDDIILIIGAGDIVNLCELLKN